MKKLFSLLVIAGMLAVVACGPSAEEKAAKEKAKQDSIAAAQKAIDDSIAAVAKADSIAAAEKAKRIEDSIAALPKAKGGTKPPTTKPGQPIPKDQVKAGQGKG